MPELIEVFLTSSYLNSKVSNRNIKSIKAIKGKYKKNPINGLVRINELKPNTISVRSKGKLMWFELEHDIILFCRFGLHGSWTSLKSNHNDIEIEYEGFSIYFNNIGFGSFIVSDNDGLDKELDKNHFDFLQEQITRESFNDRIKKYVSPSVRSNHKIVKVLMDQNKKTGIGSGIGNYLVAEILYKAKISPHTTMSSIKSDKNRVNDLCYAIQYTIKNAFYNIKSNYLDDDKEFSDYINKFRKQCLKNNMFYPNIKIPKSFEFKVYGVDKDENGNKVIKEEIIGKRKTHWIPSIQI